MQLLRADLPVLVGMAWHCCTWFEGRDPGIGGAGECGARADGQMEMEMEMLLE